MRIRDDADDSEVGVDHQGDAWIDPFEDGDADWCFAPSVGTTGPEPSCGANRWAEAGSGGEGQPAELSNTAGLNNQHSKQSEHTPQLISGNGGLDWLEVSIYGEARNEVLWAALIERLEAAKAEAQRATECLAEVDLSGLHRGLVRAGAMRYGTAFLAFVVEVEGITFRVGRLPDFKENRATASVLIGSETLMAQGICAWQRAVDLLHEAFGIAIKDTCVARCDACVDFPNRSVEPFVLGALDPQQNIKRANKLSVHKYRDAWTGVSVGTGTVLRIYDKAAELRDKPNESKYAIIQRDRWGGAACREAVRVEFQMRRELLKRFSVRTIEELLAALPGIVEYLSTEWFRLVDCNDRSHYDRTETLPIWAEVQAEFGAAFRGEKLRRSPTTRPKPSAERLFKQAIGCITSALSVVGERPDSEGEVLAALGRQIQPYLKGAPEGVEKKRRRLMSAGKLDTPDPVVEFLAYDPTYTSTATSSENDECELWNYRAA